MPDVFLGGPGYSVQGGSAPGLSSTLTSGPTRYMPGVGGGLTDLASAFGRLALARARQRMAEEDERMDWARAGQADLSRQRAGQAEDERFRRHNEAVDRSQTTGPAPSKYVTVGGQSFLTTDPMAMSALQRRAYLPNNAEGANLGGPPISSPSQDLARYAQLGAEEAQGNEEQENSRLRQALQAQALGGGPIIRPSPFTQAPQQGGQ